MAGSAPVDDDIATELPQDSGYCGARILKCWVVLMWLAFGSS